MPLSSEYAAELYVHAIAIEREAAERYAQFAELFRLLASLKAKRLEQLMRSTHGVELPPLEADYTWPGSKALDALRVALQAEKGARAFFEQAARVSDDAAVRELAREMVAEEAEHAATLERLLARMPEEDR